MSSGNETKQFDCMVQMLSRVSSFLSVVDNLMFNSAVSVISKISSDVMKYEDAPATLLSLCKRIKLVLTDATSIVSLKPKVITPLSRLTARVSTLGLLESSV